jgi:hypothetical protein
MVQTKLSPLEKLRADPSPDGRYARFVLMNRAGQHLAFIIPFDRIGLLLRAIKRLIGTMRDRLFARKPEAASVLHASLTAAPPIAAVTVAHDGENGDALLCLETADEGLYSFRFNTRAVDQLMEALMEYKTSSDSPSLAPKSSQADEKKTPASESS